MADNILTVQHQVGKRWSVGTALSGPYFRLVVAPHEKLDVVEKDNAVYIQIRGRNGND